MNKAGIIPIAIWAMAGIIIFIALAAIGIGFLDFMKRNFIWILLIAAAYLVIFKKELWKGLLK